MLPTFLNEIMLLTALGAFLDTVFVDEKIRARLSNYLEQGKEDLTPDERMTKFLSLAHSIIFGRFFTSRVNSLSFICAAAIVSIISFSIVIALQFFFFPELFDDLSFSPTQVGLFIAFIAFNMAFDYVTILQTKIFIEAAVRAKSSFRAIVFVGSDIIVTMNTFILAYAYFLLIVVQIFVSTPNVVTAIFEKPISSPEFDIERASQLIPDEAVEGTIERLSFSGNITGGLTTKPSLGEANTIFVPYYSSFELTQERQQAEIFAALSTLNIFDITFEHIDDESREEVYRNILSDSRSALANALRSDSADEDLSLMSFHVDGSVIQQGSMSSAYTSAFFMTDQLEDGFPASLIGPLDLPRLSTIIARSIAPLFPPYPIAICFMKDELHSRFYLTSQSAIVLQNCDDFVVLDRIWVQGMDRDLILAGREVEEFRVPYNTLFATSVLPTAFFYFAIILLSVATSIANRVVKGANRAKKYFLRAPLAIAGFMVGLILSIIQVGLSFFGA